MKIHSTQRLSYGDGSLAVRAVTENGVEVLSVNLAAYNLIPPSPDMFYVKDYAENEGLPKSITEQGIARPIAEVFIGPFDSRCVLMELIP